MGSGLYTVPAHMLVDPPGHSRSRSGRVQPLPDKHRIPMCLKGKAFFRIAEEAHASSVFSTSPANAPRPVVQQNKMTRSCYVPFFFLLNFLCAQAQLYLVQGSDFLPSIRLIDDGLHLCPAALSASRVNVVCLTPPSAQSVFFFVNGYHVRVSGARPFYMFGSSRRSPRFWSGWERFRGRTSISCMTDVGDQWQVDVFIGCSRVPVSAETQLESFFVEPAQTEEPQESPEVVD